MELKKKDQGQRYRLGRCSMWVVVEGMGGDATPLGGYSERGEAEEGLIPGRHQYFKGQAKECPGKKNVLPSLNLSMVSKSLPCDLNN